MERTSARPRFAYFGTPLFATIILDELEKSGYVPAVIISAPDKPKGRKLLITPSEVKVWGESRNIPVLTPEKLRNKEFAEVLRSYQCDLFIVAAYGKIIPKEILEMPTYGVLNVHPSLLPKFRGPSPIESAILSKVDHTGVTIMKLDEELDHGDIVAQEEYHAEAWPPKGSALTIALAHQGGILLAKIIPLWMKEQHSKAQDHTQATFTKKITKEDGLIDLSHDASLNYKKIRAFDEWPGAYFFTERNGKKIRVRIIDATLSDGVLKILRVVPEGKKEMSYEDFLRGGQ